MKDGSLCDSPQNFRNIAQKHVKLQAREIP